jgi:hypothetical protein
VRGARTTGPGVLAVLGAVLVIAVGTVVVVPGALIVTAGLFALVCLAPLLRRLAAGAAWSLPVLVSLAVLLVDVGGRTLAPGPWRYAATAAVVLVILLIGVRPGQAGAALRATALVLFAYGLVGTAYGRLVLGTENGTLPLIGPLVIACLPPVRNWGAVPHWRSGLRMVSAACAVFAVLSGLSRMGLLPETQVDVLNHEKAFVVVLGIVAAVAARSRLWFLVAVGAAVFAFLQYPAATYLVAAVAVLGTLVLVRWAPRPGVRVVLAVTTMAATALAVLQIDDLIRLTRSYFVLVGKIDNGGTREALYRAALSKFDSPVFGSLFTGDITVVGELSGVETVVPVHNDYLSISLGGGVVAAALLLGLFLFANGLVLRSLPGMTDPFQRRTAVALLTAVNGAAVSAFANPIFMNPGASTVVFALLAGLVAVCGEVACNPEEEERLERDLISTELPGMDGVENTCRRAGGRRQERWGGHSHHIGVNVQPNSVAPIGQRIRFRSGGVPLRSESQQN